MSTRTRSATFVGLFAGLFVALLAPSAAAATKYWVSGLAGCSGVLTDNKCWSTASGGGNNTTAPTAASNDDVHFDGNGTGSCSFTTAGTAIALRTITIAAGYTGTLNMVDAGALNPDVTVGAAGITAISQGAGTIALNGAQLAVTGNLSVTGGTFNAGTATATLAISGSTTIRGATAVFQGGAGATTFTGTVNVDTGGSFSAGTGALTFTGTMTLGAAATTGTWTPGTATLAFNNGLTLTNGSMDLSTATAVSGAAGNVTVSAGTLTMGGATVTFPAALVVRGATAVFQGGTGSTTITGVTDIDTSGVFNASAGAVTFGGLLTIGAAATTGTFNTGTATLTFKNGITLTNGNLDLSTANAATSITAGNVNVNTGTMSLGGLSLSFPGALTVRGAAGSSPVFLGGTGSPSFTGNVTIDTAGAFTAATGTNTFTGTLSVGAAGSAGTFMAGSATLALNGGTTNLQGSGTVFHANTSHITTSGAINGSTSSVLDCDSATISVGTSMTFTTADVHAGTSHLTLATSLTVQTSGNFYAESGTILIGTTVNVATSAIFDTTTGSTGAALTFTGTFTTTATVGFTGAASTVFMGAIRVNAGGTMAMGPAATVGTSLRVRGAGAVLNANANTLIVTTTTTVDQGGTLNATSGTKTFTTGFTVGAATPTAGTVNLGTATVTLGAVSVTDSTLDLSTVTSSTFTSSVSVNASGTMTLGPAASIPTTLLVRGASAVLNAGSATLSVAGATTIDQGGVVNAGSGSKTFTGTVTLGANTPTTGVLHVGTSSISMGGALNMNDATIYAESGTLSVAGNTALATSSTIDTTTGSTGSTLNFTGSLGVTTSTVDFTGASATTFGASVSANSSGIITMGPSATIGTSLLVRGAGAVFNASGNALTVTTTTNVDQAGTFRANAGTVTFSGAAQIGANTPTTGTFTMGAANLTFTTGLTVYDSSVDFTAATATTFPGSLSVQAAATVTMGPAATIGTTLTVSGAAAVFNASSHALTVTGTTNINTSAVFNANGCTNLQLSSGANAVVIGSGGGAGTFNSNSATITFNGNNANSLLIQDSSTFDGGTATLTFGAGMTTNTNDEVNVFLGTMDLTNTTSTNWSPSGAVGNVNVSVGSTLTLGASGAVMPHNLTVNGAFNARGTVSIAGTTVVSNAAADFEGQTANITFTGAVTNSAGKLYLVSAGLSFASSLTVSGGTTTLGSQTVTFTALSVSVSGSFKAGSANVTVSGAVSVSSGTADFSGTSTGPTFSNTVTVSGGSLTLGSGTVGIASTLTVNGGVFNAGSSTLTVTGATNVYVGGTFNSGSNVVNLNNTLTLGQNTPNAGSFNCMTATITGKALTIEGGSVFDGGSGANNVTFTTLSLGASVTLAASTLNAGSRTGTLTFSGASTINAASVFDGKTATSIVFSTTLAVGSTSAGSFLADAATCTFSGTVTVAYGSTFDGGTSPLMTFNTAATSLVLGNATPTTGAFTATSSRATFAGIVQILGASTFHSNSSPGLTFNGGVQIGNGSAGTFFADSCAAVAFNGVVTLQSAGVFNGNTGTGTFAVAPTLTSGTFNVADAGSTGRWTFQASATFTSGVTLAFPTNKGELSLAATKVLTLNGPVISNVGSASTLPKIDCNGCTAAQGITIAFGATSTLNINGLEFDNSVATGVSIASGATYTLLKRLKFQNNVGGGSSTHLLITLATAVINVPGCYFDSTATTNVTLDGTAGQIRGARAIFEFQSTAINGPLAGNAHDSDGDKAPDPNPDNNYGENVAAPFYGSVVEWAGASETDTAGTAVGFPTAAFDWNTFAFYGIYVAYKDTAGVGTADVVWMRNNDGSAAYSFSVPQTSGDIVGTPVWDSVNETTAGVDANGNGNMTDTDVHVLYIGTSLGHIIKLVDNGSALLQPAGGPWASDFTSGSVSTISSPLSEDGTNLYFGGTGGGTKVFAVQIAGGANEKTLQRNIGAVSAITATPTWTVFGGSTYVFLGSTATAGQAYIYRINMSSGTIDASFSGLTSSVNDSVRFENDLHAYAVTDGGQLEVIDALNFGTGNFKNVTHFPYQSAAASPIKFADYVDYSNDSSYFGDNAGNVYVVTNVGANLAGFPLSLGAIQITSSPMFLTGGGIIAVGANDGYVYFINRNNGSNVPVIYKRFFVTGAGSVSSVAYDQNTSKYMVSSSDGKLIFVNGSDVLDPDGTH